MPAFNVAELSALEILDSRGRPTLAVTVRLADGTAARAGVPSGASTGSREAVERRDGDPDRYEGKGVLGAVSAVNTEIAGLLRGRPWASLAEADQAMIDLDGTANKSRLGANATVGTSMALARALAAAAGVPLWQWLTPDGVTPSLPVPHFNVLNGGVHAPNALDFQEFMIAPLGAPSMAEAVRAGAEVYSALRRELTAASCPPAWATRAASPPRSPNPNRSCGCWCRPSPTPATSPAPTASPSRWTWRLRVPPARRPLPGGRRPAVQQRHDRPLAAICGQFPVHLIEDGLGEDDEDGWIALTARLGATTELVGDDIFCTNPAIITAAIARHIGNSALIKLNQIGTVTETLQAMAICRQAATGSSSPTAPAKPKTTSSPTWPSAPAAATSRPAPPPAENASPNTTGSWRSPPAPQNSATACPDGNHLHPPHTDGMCSVGPATPRAGYSDRATR